MMIKTCANCGEEFETSDIRRKYCTVECRNEQISMTRKEKSRQRKEFLREWEAWQRDFILERNSAHGQS